MTLSSLRRTILVLALLLLGQCSTQIADGGNSSETGNTTSITASRDTLLVHTMPRSFIGIYSSAYLPYTAFGFADTIVADSSGNARFLSLARGSYNVFIHDSLYERGLFISSIMIDSLTHAPALFDSLLYMAEFSDTARSQSVDTIISWCYAFVPGSPFWGYTGKFGKYTLSKIPEGSYQLEFFGISPLSACADTTCTQLSLSEETISITVIADSSARILPYRYIL